MSHPYCIPMASLLECGEDQPSARKQPLRMEQLCRMLVDVNETTRRKGIAKIANFFEKTTPLSESHIEYIWTTLYYGAWLSDKHLPQRDFFVRAALLHKSIPTIESKSYFFEYAFKHLVGEWDKIDRHRVNKFLLFVRILYSEWMNALIASNWDRFMVNKATQLLANEILLCQKARGIALHLIDIIYEEYKFVLDNLSKSENYDSNTRTDAYRVIFIPYYIAVVRSQDSSIIQMICNKVFSGDIFDGMPAEFIGKTLYSTAVDSRLSGPCRKYIFSAANAMKEYTGVDDEHHSNHLDTLVKDFTDEIFTFKEEKVSATHHPIAKRARRMEESNSSPSGEQQPMSKKRIMNNRKDAIMSPIKLTQPSENLDDKKNEQRSNDGIKRNDEHENDVERHQAPISIKTRHVVFDLKNNQVTTFKKQTPPTCVGRRSQENPKLGKSILKPPRPISDAVVEEAPVVLPLVKRRQYSGCIGKDMLQLLQDLLAKQNVPRKTRFSFMNKRRRIIMLARATKKALRKQKSF